MQITTHQLTPHPAPGESVPVFDSLHLRELVNYLVRESWDKLEQQQLNPNLFFNRDQTTNTTQIRYPQVIYHCINGQFFLTGINDGAKAVDFITQQHAAPFEYKTVLFSGFKPHKSGQLHPETTNQHYAYALQNWIPVHHRQNKAFACLPLPEKVTQMQEQLQKHIEKEYCKYLGISAENLSSQITDITHKHAAPVLYKGYRFWSYNIEFNCNLKLPEMLCLGNNKALGFGRIIPIA